MHELHSPRVRKFNCHLGPLYSSYSRTRTMSVINWVGKISIRDWMIFRIFIPLNLIYMNRENDKHWHKSLGFESSSNIDRISLHVFIWLMDIVLVHPWRRESWVNRLTLVYDWRQVIVWWRLSKQNLTSCGGWRI